MNYFIKPVVTAVLGAVTFMDFVDLGTRCVSATCAVVVAYHAVRQYKTRRKLDEAQLKRLNEGK
jgi:hypothetical protein